MNMNLTRETIESEGKHKAVRWHPPSFDIRVESIPIPRIEHPDDAIVKVKLAGLCGSDLHVYRGLAGVSEVHTCGHEFIGEVVLLGNSYGSHSTGRPALYATLKIGDKVVSPFTSNCGECHYCRVGFTCRCPEGALFGSPKLAGGQAQYVRVPKAGGTLFNLSDPSSWSATLKSNYCRIEALSKVRDTSLLMLSDILPTGIFAALQVLNHPKILPITTKRSWPDSYFPSSESCNEFTEKDQTLTLAVIGLGPVGVCACVSLLDMLSTRDLPFQVLAVDPNALRREKMEVIYSKIVEAGRGRGKFVVADVDDANRIVQKWTSGLGCNGVLEVVGNNLALLSAYNLVRPFGAIVSVGVHQETPLLLTGAQLYAKNISLDFGRCPARAMFPMAFELLVKRQDIFGGVGDEASLVDKVVGFDQAADYYKIFNEGNCGKVLFDPWA